MLWDKIDLAFLHMHMEMSGRGFTINIDSVSEAQHWLRWKSLAGGRGESGGKQGRGTSWSFHLGCVEEVQARIIDFGGDIEGVCWGLLICYGGSSFVPLPLCLIYFLLRKKALFEMEAIELPALSLFYITMENMHL